MPQTEQSYSDYGDQTPPRSRDEKLQALRAFGVPLGVEWLRDTLKAYQVERISDLAEADLGRLLVEFVAAEQAAVSA